jgi:hypothetical protein
MVTTIQDLLTRAEAIKTRGVHQNTKQAIGGLHRDTIETLAASLAIEDVSDKLILTGSPEEVYSQVMLKVSNYLIIYCSFSQVAATDYVLKLDGFTPSYTLQKLCVSSSQNGITDAEYTAADGGEFVCANGTYLGNTFVFGIVKIAN